MCATAAPNVALSLPSAPTAPTAALRDVKRGKMVIGQEPCKEVMGWGFSVVEPEINGGGGILVEIGRGDWVESGFGEHFAFGR